MVALGVAGASQFPFSVWQPQEVKYVGVKVPWRAGALPSSLRSVTHALASDSCEFSVYRGAKKNTSFVVKLNDTKENDRLIELMRGEVLTSRWLLLAERCGASQPGQSCVLGETFFRVPHPQL